jgi:2,3-bisphosphoglycerate-dependent phosphoglycerate mutase
MRIFLIRHGESIANVGENYVKRVADHLVSLTEKGKEQARINGEWLANYCKENNIDISKARIWRSPYLRTRQTSEEFNKYLNITDIREDITLTEQQFGLFDSVPEEDWGKLYPAEYAEYERQRSNYGKFYARLPLGESPFDVAIRVHQFMGTIHRDLEKHGVDTLFIFTHGTTLRTFLLRWFHYSPEWYHEERNPRNCWIREIDGKTDKGYINKDVLTEK